MRIGMRPRADQPFLRSLQSGKESRHGIAVAIAPAADRIDGAGDARIVLVDGGMLPECVTSLVAHPEGLLFNDLKELCSLTDGNLNRHLAVLEEAQLVTTNRPAKRGRPQTVVVLTSAGRRRFQQYLNVLEQVGAQVAPRGDELRLGVAGLGHVEERARLGVPLAEQ